MLHQFEAEAAFKVIVTDEKGEQEAVVSHKVAKCHGYDGYIRVKILAGWGVT